MFSVASFENVHVHLFKITENWSTIYVKVETIWFGGRKESRTSRHDMLDDSAVYGLEKQIQSAQNNSLIYFSLVSNGISK